MAITGFPITVSGATTTAGSPTIAVPSITGLAVGMAVSGTGFAWQRIHHRDRTRPNLDYHGHGCYGSSQDHADLYSSFLRDHHWRWLCSEQQFKHDYWALESLLFKHDFCEPPGGAGVDAVVTGQQWHLGRWHAKCNPDPTGHFLHSLEGKVQPQFSEDYTIIVQADDGCTLKINGQPQVLKISPSANNGGSNYKYYAGTGDLAVTYTSQPVVTDAYVVGKRCGSIPPAAPFLTLPRIRRPIPMSRRRAMR